LKKSPLGDRTVSNGAGRGHAAKSTVKMPAENMASPTQSTPAPSTMKLGMDGAGSKGTSGRKGFPTNT